VGRDECAIVPGHPQSGASNLDRCPFWDNRDGASAKLLNKPLGRAVKEGVATHRHNHPFAGRNGLGAKRGKFVKYRLEGIESGHRGQPGGQRAKTLGCINLSGVG
jgi:hypothetical protein